MKGSNRGMKVHSLNGLVLERYSSQTWAAGFPALALLVLITLLMFLSLSVSAALAVSTPLFATCKVDAQLDAASADKISVEQYEETVVVKGMTWEGTASWSVAAPPDPGTATPCQNLEETAIFSSKVRIEGALLTEGTLEGYMDNPGVLSLKYSFLGEDGSVLGTADGFVSMAAVGDLAGSASFKGEVTVEGKPIRFYGTGAAEAAEFTANAVDVSEAVAKLEAWKLEALQALDREYQQAMYALRMQYGNNPVLYTAKVAELRAAFEQARAAIEAEYQAALAQIGQCTASGRLSQTMDKTVLTASKPGFTFETAKQVPQLNRQYMKAKKALIRERLGRLRVLNALGPR